MVKICTPFQTKTAQNDYPFGLHNTYTDHISEYHPPGGNSLIYPPTLCLSRRLFQHLFNRQWHRLNSWSLFQPESFDILQGFQLPTLVLCQWHLKTILAGVIILSENKSKNDAFSTSQNQTQAIKAEINISLHLQHNA